ncbi:hypothetical protein CDL12_00735 [Handroanthus impetiginosus]|uniref:Ubiquitinyl hydrolase 1 n=1 Tax=Handroanthus impetiginosus TaxID=429701 RepID=A0A2G9I9S5_9LAMI|nr:hypothetical protein CDL12_00735 [Handroanthus impetiginosus]
MSKRVGAEENQKKYLNGCTIRLMVFEFNLTSQELGLLNPGNTVAAIVRAKDEEIKELKKRIAKIEEANKSFCVQAPMNADIAAKDEKIKDSQTKDTPIKADTPANKEQGDRAAACEEQGDYATAHDAQSDYGKDKEDEEEKKEEEKKNEEDEQKEKKNEEDEQKEKKTEEHDHKGDNEYNDMNEENWTKLRAGQCAKQRNIKRDRALKKESILEPEKARPRQKEMVRPEENKIKLEAEMKACKK